jgi:hypothetical protein
LPASDAIWNHAERGDAVGADAAQFAVEIGLARRERRDRRRDLRILAGPVEPVAGQQPNIAVLEPGMHAEPVVFDFVQPLVAVRRGIDELRQLRPYPLGKRGARRCGSRHLECGNDDAAA